ncbi:MAG: hypothetical protein MPJ50_03870 [Pirellulales bacterium]|nr:hypothetical protein [Pirellulales bacterium]
MPVPNNFRHQRYTADPPVAPYRLLKALNSSAEDTELSQTRLHQIGQQLRAARVRAILLAHGTFAGPDTFGMIDAIAGMLEKLNSKLKQVAKRVVDALARDGGNFTEKYATLLRDAINVGYEPSDQEYIRVERFHWSSENNHIGRADGAVRLVEEISRMNLSAPSKLLMLGHSHGGNVMALATNLIHADMPALERFFAAAKAYYCIPGTKTNDVPHWSRVKDILMHDGPKNSSARAQLRESALDWVTLGTPIRYGWDLTGNQRLLHLVNHRPTERHPTYLARIPESMEQLWQADVGDLIHLLGIAGTNLIPSPISPRAVVADRKLHSVLQSGVRRSEFGQNFRRGMRVAEQGTTLLVDFGPKDDNVVRSLAGHAIYTRLPKLEFLMKTIADLLYKPTA